MVPPWITKVSFSAPLAGVRIASADWTAAAFADGRPGMPTVSSVRLISLSGMIGCAPRPSTGAANAPGTPFAAPSATSEPAPPIVPVSEPPVRTKPASRTFSPSGSPASVAAKASGESTLICAPGEDAIVWPAPTAPSNSMPAGAAPISI